MLREYGWRQRYVSERPGRNSRLDELQAAILRIKLIHLDADNAKRRELAAQYTQNLNGSDVVTPEVRLDAEHVFHLYVVRVHHREALIASLKAFDIHPGIHYPVPIHGQGAYQRRIRTTSSMKVTEALALDVLSLPMYPELAPEQVVEVVQMLKTFR